MDSQIIQKIAIYAIPMIFAITVHEAAHGYAAKHFGDRTAEMLGRLSLNPIRHIDPIGTILVPLITVLLSGFFFGWAKPVPVSTNNLRNPKLDMAWVALAGPGANLLMAVLWAVALKLLSMAGDSGVVEFWVLVAQAGVLVNILLMVLNLFPLLPLDGGRVLAALLPGKLSYAFSRLEPYGMLILIALLMTGVLSVVLRPVEVFSINAVLGLVGLR